MPAAICPQAGGDYCPCALVATGECPACPALAGGPCDCEWTGDCILQHALAHPPSVPRPRVDAQVALRAETPNLSRLVLVPAGGPLPAPDEPCSCYVLKAHDSTLVAWAARGRHGASLNLAVEGAIPQGLQPGSLLGLWGPYAGVSNPRALKACTRPVLVIGETAQGVAAGLTDWLRSRGADPALRQWGPLTRRYLSCRCDADLVCSLGSATQHREVRRALRDSRLGLCVQLRVAVPPRPGGVTIPVLSRG